MYSFWGKAEREGTRYHSAVLHMLDTGIVARHLLGSMPEGFRKYFHAEFADDPTLSSDLTIGFFASLHDLGKISPGFQGKRDDLFERLKPLGFRPPNAIDETRHGQVLLDVLPDLLSRELKCPEEAGMAITRALAAHHGAFLFASEGLSGAREWAKARENTVALLAKTLGIGKLAGIRTPSTPVLMLFAGLVSVADWLASAEEYFPYLNGPPKSISQYLQDRNNRAKGVIAKLRFQMNQVPSKAFSDLFDFSCANPCQVATLRAAEKLHHPFLLVIESPTGTGKTVHGEHYRSRLEARLSIFEYVELFYNRQRSHSALGCKTPEEYEKLLNEI